MAQDSSSLRHLLISASAGSGKTYQLVRRYLHLLALGQDAEGIAAMTFTRKAAGEFFSRILQRLAEMAQQPESAGSFFAGTEPPVNPEQDYSRMLRRVTRRMHRLRLGTLDSFFANVAACFPMELGLPAGARVMDEDDTRMARREALDALLERLYQEGDGKGQKTLMEAYKQATFGAEEKTVDQTLQDWLTDGLTLWEESPIASDEGLPLHRRGWGDLSQIWSQSWDPRGLAEAIEEVRQTFTTLSDAGADLLNETLTQVLETVPGMSLPKRVKELLDKVQDQWPDLLAGNAELMWMRKKTPVKGEAARALVRLVKVLMAREFVVRAGRTSGLADVMTMLAEEYAVRVRARGRLSFADVQRLLSTAAQKESSWAAGAGELWFRLDGRQQHWLLDEFQDTSRVQWRVIGGLVDEVIQDNSGARSFFSVGDPKQSIYLWRQAEPDLFDDILRGYPAQPGTGLHTGQLSKSFRSAQSVLDAVNGVLGDRTVLEALLPEGALKGFAFLEHTASQESLLGYSALLSPVPGLDTDEPTMAVMTELLTKIEPLKRGLSCAILVRSNHEARSMTEALRASTGMEIVCESDQHPCTDNAVTLALLSVLTLAAHPGDGKALEHLRMTPLWPLMQTEQEHYSYRLVQVQNLVYERGFAAFMEEWTPLVRQVLPEVDAFHTRRLAQMADIAAEFDAMGNRDLDMFIEFARNYPLRVRGATQSVQVMTVHASKGLEFDVVLLPSLDGTSMDQPRHEELLVSRTGDGVRWVLENPPKVYAQLDPTLKEELRETKRRTAFESLCRLYVAMTRAKRGLYFIAKEAPKGAKALKESRLLRETLGRQSSRPMTENGVTIVEWETGTEEWFAGIDYVPEVQPEPVITHAPLGQVLRKTQPMSRRRTPSGEESFHISGSLLFGEGREPGRRLGTLVHELFAEIEWMPDLDALEQRWLAKGLLNPEDFMATEGPAAEALGLVAGVIDSPCSAAFEKPSEHAQVWRERSFDLVLKGEWISGTFDRVILDRDSTGKVTQAWIVDFKTDRVPNEEALEEKRQGYAPQIALYREAIATLTGVPQSAVRCSLLFTRSLQLVDL